MKYYLNFCLILSCLMSAAIYDLEKTVFKIFFIKPYLEKHNKVISVYLYCCAYLIHIHQV
jgi:hypothetical protein